MGFASSEKVIYYCLVFIFLITHFRKIRWKIFDKVFQSIKKLNQRISMND